MERFEKVFDDIEIEDAKIERRGDKIEKVDELDEIEIMRESIEARCEKQDMSGFERVKVLVEIIEDALVLEDKLRGYVNENNQDNMEQDELEDSMIWNGIMQDCYTWDMIRSQTSEWCEESMQVYGDWPVVDRCQSVVWRDCSDYW